ncbi:MarR family winged helix-turn-helix transcriptional regulator [Photobacterium minamisatsumaniensis]|uniref:MarR family winged helix-turn-helix transcriptional regulator n=1 Tax=Photobacterium minamisatsumaniensis TaxID=2910233 RepID=UPI003D14690B
MDKNINNSLKEHGYILSEQVGHLIRKSYQKHTAIFQSLSYDEQLTSIQFATLCTIVERGPSSLTELVNETDIDQATIRGVVKRLMARELIQRVQDTQDNRKVIITITPEGRKLVEKMLPSAKKITEETLKNLNETEKVAFLFLLKKITED